MKAGQFGPQLSLMEELKATTLAAHSRLQAAPFFSALAACQFPLASYVGQLRALALIHGVLEQTLAECADDRVASVWRGDMCKLPQLELDLRYFEPRSVADIKEAVQAAQQVVKTVRLQSMEQPLSLLGFVYVLEGATLGARVLRPLVARAFLLAGEDGLSYLNSYGTAVPQRWAQFQLRMNTLQLGAAEREQINQTANEFFASLETVFLALYPFQPESRIFAVNAINPEAGSHAVPDDAREVQAALRAGDICWQRFPYFEQRYGERGRRFARSDAAWQATLHAYPMAQILQQVRWLGGVLAVRGMPTLLLEVQLEILVTELTAAVPEKRSEYEKLLAGAAALHAERGVHLSDVQLVSIGAEFDRAVGPQWRARLPDTGVLLCCAVADELSGHLGAMENLRAWLSDTERFPPEWIAAVAASLAQAQAQAQARDIAANNRH